MIGSKASDGYLNWPQKEQRPGALELRGVAVFWVCFMVRWLF